MKQLNRTILIVHPFTSDKVLYSTIKSRGYKIITLITQLDLNWVAHCKDTITKFSDHVMNVSGISNTDVQQIESLCKQHELQISGVINAFDYSLEYADTLSQYFVGIDLDIAFSKLRCDKFKVNQELANAQVRHIKSVIINNENKFDNIVDKLEQLNFPVIIKPSSLSAARNHVMIADNFTSLTKIVKHIQQAKSIFTNELITEILVQEYIEGEEFFVNAVSYGNQHYVAGIFKYKKNKDKIFGVWSLDGHENSAVNKLIQYNKDCLDGLKVKYGMTHNEFIIDKHGDPYLIEMNNRLSGVEVPILSRICYASDEVTVFLDLLENKPVHEFDLQKISAYARIPYFSNFVNPNATKLNLDEIKSQHEIITFRTGVVSDSKDNKENLFVKVSSALYLFNKDKSIVDNDVELLFSREDSGTLFI